MTNSVQELVSHLTKGVDKSPEPRLIILVGLPYSGKSTLAEKLTEYGFVHLWVTKLKRNFELDDTRAFNLVDELLPTLFGRGYSVTVDALNHRRKDRQRLKAIAEAAGVPSSVVHFDVSRSTLSERRRVVQQKGGGWGRSIISEEVIEEIQNELDVPNGPGVVTIGDSTV